VARRTKNWNPGIAKKLQSKAYRQEFFLTLVEEEGLDLREAIFVFAQSMGNQEFAKLVDMPASNASRAANPKNDVKWTTVEHILSKIGVNLSAKVA
jgi:hypothetical protein